MATNEGLEAEIGITLNKLTKQLATAEARMTKSANKWERDFARANARAAKSMDQVQNAVGRTSRRVDVLGAALTAAFSAREVIRYADAWTVAGNKIAAASEVSGIQARSLSEINDIAAETRSGIEETTDLYAKLLRATKDVAKSEEEVARATTIVNKAFKAGGAAASEQAAGILQLAQGLSSGVLQGDELRSLRENAPLVAQAIADEFETTIGGLKELGAEGELTAARVFKAILKAQEPIEAAFAKTNSTISESFTVLTNSITEYIGNADKASGASEKIANAMLVLADNIDAVVLAGGILAGRFVGPVLLGMFARAVPILRGAALAIAGVGSAATASAAGLATMRGAFALMGGPFGVLIAGLTALPLLMESSTEKAAAMATASDNAADALISFAEASMKAAQEQEGLEGKISATTQALVNQSREAVQNSRRELIKLRDEALADLTGQGLFDLSAIEPAQAKIRLQIQIDKRAGEANRFLESINEELQKIEDGSNDFGPITRQMDALAGVGKEVNTVLRIFDQALEGSAAEMRHAGVPMVDLAKQLKLSPDLIKAIDDAQSEADVQSAYVELREAMIEAMEASEVLRDGAVSDMRTLADSVADLNEKIKAMDQGLLDVDSIDLDDPFKQLKQGADEAAASVEELNKKMLAAKGEYVQSRGFSDARTRGRAVAAASRSGLRDLIGLAEGTDRGRGYNETLGYGAFTGGDVVLVNKTLNEILEIQRKMLAHPDNGYNSSAVGRYQIVSRTLRDLMGQLNLSGDELFDEGMQDMLADQLIARRGRDVGGLRNEWEGLRNIPAADIETAFDTGAGDRAGRIQAQTEAIKAENEALKEQQATKQGLVASAQEDISRRELEIGLIGKSVEEQVRLRTEMELLNEAKRLGIDVDKELTASGKTYRQEIEALARATGELAAKEKVRLEELRNTEATQGTVNSQASSLKSTFLDMATGIRSAADAAAQLAQQLARAYLEAALFGSGPFAQKGGGGGLFGGLVGGGGGFFGKLLGFSEGGPTGPGGKYEPAGVVHKGEYVMNAKATRNLGVGTLDKLHRAAQIGGLPGFANGGGVGGFVSSKLPSMNIKQAAPQVNVGSPEVKMSIANVLDPSIVGNYLDTEEGEEKFINLMYKTGFAERA